MPVFSVETRDKLVEASKKKSSTHLMKCLECGARFKKKIGPNTSEIKCPKCGSHDVDYAPSPGHVMMKI